MIGLLVTFLGLSVCFELPGGWNGTGWRNTRGNSLRNSSGTVIRDLMML
jgi:hypothetical protein